MVLYFLEYDLRDRRDYKKIEDELVRRGAIRILKSLWCFKHNKTKDCEELIKHFANFLDEDDGLAIMEVADWAIMNASSSPKKLG